MGIAQVPEGRRIFSRLPVKDNLKLGQYIIKDSGENKEKDRAQFYAIFPRMSERKISWPEPYPEENNRC